MQTDTSMDGNKRHSVIGLMISFYLLNIFRNFSFHERIRDDPSEERGGWMDDFHSSAVQEWNFFIIIIKTICTGWKSNNNNNKNKRNNRTTK